MWRFRWSLVGEPRALMRVLQCVDWSDALEARQAGDLMAAWAPIHASHALELLSPAFPHPEVCPPTHWLTGMGGVAWGGQKGRV